MPGILHLDWDPSAKSAGTAPPAGHANALYRGDTYEHEFQLWQDEAKTVPFEITDPVFAQIRPRRLDEDDLVAAPLASFTCDVSGAGLNIITITLLAAQTLVLPSKGFWDLQVNNVDPITTLLLGKVVVLDDVTRVA